MTKLTVVLLTEETIPDAVGLSEKMLTESVLSKLGFNLERVNEFAKQSISLGDRAPVFIAYDGDKAIGFLAASLTPVAFTYAFGAMEEYFYVLPEYRGSRAAYILVREFMAWARSHNPSFIRAGVSTGVVSGAGKLYEHFGMMSVGTNHMLML
jgi:GNAT superfamily N-acetyltransferase